MKLHFSNSPSFLPESMQKTEVSTSRAFEKSTSFSDEKSISKLHEQALVQNYFTLFDTNLSETAIKNLISERLQPTRLLSTVHNTEKLAQSAKELLDFSVHI